MYIVELKVLHVAIADSTVLVCTDLNLCMIIANIIFYFRIMVDVIHAIFITKIIQAESLQTKFQVSLKLPFVLDIYVYIGFDLICA